ncbi:MAG: hypothetical protein H6Q19_931 [Bacteroidetes bacterium]|nr:hypothetical protein [Bacteroidota bacterium]
MNKNEKLWTHYSFYGNHVMSTAVCDLLKYKVFVKLHLVQIS